MHRLAFAFLIVLVGLGSAPAAWAGAPIDPLVGKFSGEVEIETDNGLQKRSVTVTIAKTSRGFTVDWTTTIPKTKGRRKIKKYTIQFSQAQRKKLYPAGMRRNLFGKLVPLNPLKGDPYMWAAIRNGTLFVYGMHVTDDGGYEFQINERRVDGDTMHVTFRRFRDGQQLKAINATLKRQK